MHAPLAKHSSSRRSVYACASPASDFSSREPLAHPHAVSIIAFVQPQSLACRTSSKSLFTSIFHARWIWPTVVRAVRVSVCRYSIRYAVGYRHETPSSPGFRGLSLPFCVLDSTETFLKHHCLLLHRAGAPTHRLPRPTPYPRNGYTTTLEEVEGAKKDSEAANTGSHVVLVRLGRNEQRTTVWPPSGASRIHHTFHLDAQIIL